MADCAHLPIPENPPKVTELPYKRARLLGSLNEVITLLIGEGHQRTSISVHKNVLCASSPFFEAACKPEWMATDKIIKLPEDDPEAVQGMVYWMYENTICVSKEIDQRICNYTNDPDDTKAMKTKSGFFVKLYALGEKYQIPRLQNHALDACTKHWAENRLNHGVISYVYQNTSLRNAPLRRLLVHVTIFENQVEMIRLYTEKHHLCPDFVLDVALAFLEGTAIVDKRKNPLDSICEDYHVRSQEGEKEACTISEFIFEDESES